MTLMDSGLDLDDLAGADTEVCMRLAENSRLIATLHDNPSCAGRAGRASGGGTTRAPANAAKRPKQSTHPSHAARIEDQVRRLSGRAGKYATTMPTPQ